ncbi:MAG: ThiF family adenylyltransferase [Candidatus Omnitrophica bacterium]|nr:ThiF family adenylyltransferase [Candidatus Omnitrophota bacterium]
MPEEKSNMQTTEFQYDLAFDRNIGWLTREEQNRLRNSCVVIAGVGGTGGFQAQVLARLGVGHFKLVDPDTFELTNINRQIGATVPTIGKFKAEVVREMIHQINPKAEVEIHMKPLARNNADEIFESANLAIDGIDFFEGNAKMVLYSKGMEKGVPVITVAPIGFGGSLIIFTPEGMDPYSYFDYHDGLSEADKRMALAFGLTPTPLCLQYMRPQAMDFEGKRASSVCPALMLAGAVTGTEAVKILTGRGKIFGAPHVYQLDLFTQQVRKSYYRWGMRSPWLRLKKFILKKYLNRKKT